MENLSLKLYICKHTVVNSMKKMHCHDIGILKTLIQSQSLPVVVIIMEEKLALRQPVKLQQVKEQLVMAVQLLAQEVLHLAVYTSIRFSNWYIVE